MANINDQSLRTNTWKGYIQFKDPASSTYYRLKERQTASITFGFDYSQHYSDSGSKALDPTGYGHAFSTTIKVTSDMVDDIPDGGSSGDAPVDQKTISYWIYKASKLEPIDLTFVARMVALSGPSGQTDEVNIWFKFKVRLTSFGTGYTTAGGSQNFDISGIITEINTIERTNSTTEPSATTNWNP
jgi:hypothetical protein